MGLAGLQVTRLGAKPFSAQVGFAAIAFGVDEGMIKAPERKTIKNTVHQNGTENEQVNPCTPAQAALQKNIGKMHIVSPFFSSNVEVSFQEMWLGR